ncbi:MAG: aminotransferase class III-fold pyridoxal phosphate-dependent enzyme, partial [Microbacterium sp.]
MGDVRGLGLMQGVEFVTDSGEPNPELAAAVQQAAIAEKLLLLTCGTSGNVVRIIPALTVTAEEIATGIERLGDAVRAAQGALQPTVNA